MIDLHLHSLYSDGSFLPGYVMKLAHSSNVSLVSLTDHDCIMGLDEARRTAKLLGMTFVNGVELEADVDISTGLYIHILAYGFNDIEMMTRYLDNLRNERIDLINRYIKIMQGQGLSVDFNAIKSLTPGIHLTCNHVAVWLVRNGIYSSFEEAKKYYLLPSSPYYLNRRYHTVEEIIALVHKCGGIPVLAHPYRIGYSETKLNSFVSYLRSIGLMGIETYYSTHTIRQVEFAKYLSRKYNLFTTAGSDWHDFTDKFLPGIKTALDDKKLITEHLPHN